MAGLTPLSVATLKQKFCKSRHVTAGYSRILSVSRPRWPTWVKLIYEIWDFKMAEEEELVDIDITEWKKFKVGREG